MADDDKKPENQTDILYGGSGDSWLHGGRGDDWLYGGDGADVLTGGSGADTVSGGRGGDWIRGGSGDDTIHGGEGADLILGDTGDDTLTGGEGADTFSFTPGHGDDTITDFDTARDKIDLSLLTASVSFEQLQGKMSTVTDPDNPDKVTGVQIDLTEFGGGTITLGGITDPAALTAAMFVLPDGESPLDDVLAQAPVEGTDAHEIFLGGTGGDTYRAMGGQDIVWAEEGDDTVYGGAGNDLILGGEGDDVIDGGVGHDVLAGGEGADTLTGGEGHDLLFGGQGADTFVFGAGHGNDRIADFTDGEDAIDLSALTGVTGFGDLTITQDGHDARIDTGQGTITLENFEVDDLDASDFVFQEAPVDGM